MCFDQWTWLGVNEYNARFNQGKLLQSTAEKLRVLENSSRPIVELLTQLILKSPLVRPKSDQFEDVNQSGQIFVSLNEIFAKKNADVYRSALHILWKQLPFWEEIEFHVGNSELPGDGLIYTEDIIKRTRDVLSNFVRAWQAAATEEIGQPPIILSQMSRICVVLKGIRNEALLKCMLDSGYTDDDLPLQHSQIYPYFKDSQDYLSLFLNEQYRAKPREWPEGSHVTFGRKEPIPMITQMDISPGSFGNISRVEDVFSKELYVLKTYKLSRDEHYAAEAKRHIQHEAQRLKSLHHRHVVRLVKTFERGREWGMIIKPAATTDLSRLLERYSRSGFNPTLQQQDSEWLRLILLTSFGCLSSGLAYIHRHMRHRDIKPSNILYEKALPTNDNAARFIWADFGLAYDFEDANDSRTRGHRRYALRYVSPEVLTTAIPEEEYTSHWLPPQAESTTIHELIPEAGAVAHGRSDDIFAFGCVFIEILSRMVKSDILSNKDLSSSEEEKPFRYAENIPPLRAWASDMQKVEEQSDLWPLFKLAAAMIQTDPQARPRIEEIYQTILRGGEKYCCPACWKEYQASLKSD